MECKRIFFNPIDTISDIFFNLKQLFFMPGNILFSLIDSSPSLQHFLEVNCFNYGFLIGFISFLIWAFAYGMLKNSV